MPVTNPAPSVLLPVSPRRLEVATPRPTTPAQTAPAQTPTPTTPSQAPSQAASGRVFDASGRDAARRGAQSNELLRRLALTSTPASATDSSSEPPLTSSSGIDQVPPGARLSRGSSGINVERLQQRLNELGYDAGDADGDFGARTARAVRAFQDQNGLDVDGIVGRGTLASLQSKEALTPTGAPLAPTTTTTDPTTPVEPPTSTTPNSPSDASRISLARAMNQGYQYLIGNDFQTATDQLKAAGSKGMAIVDRGGASVEGVAALRAAGVVPYAYNNAFQTQPGEPVPAGVKIVGGDAQWGEQVPDFADRRWQDRRIDEAKDAARMGFGGLMLDNVPRAGGSVDAANYVKRMAVEAREASGNPDFALVLQNGEELVQAHPWLVDEGYIAGLQKEDVSFHVSGAGTGTGIATDVDDARTTRDTFAALRDRHPKLPFISVDYPRTDAQAELARRTSSSLGFNVAHIAQGDGALTKIAPKTRVNTPAAED